MEMRKWIRTKEPTTDYLVALRRSVSQDFMSVREAGTASSAISGYLAHKERAEASRKQAVATGAAQDVPARGRRLGRPGEKVTVVARVVHAAPILNPEYPERSKYLYVLRTPDGDLVRWVASKDKYMYSHDGGDVVTLQGTVKGHSLHDGEWQTEMWYCKPPAFRHTVKA